MDRADTPSGAVLALDGEWRLTSLNREAERLFDRPREQLLGRRIWDVHPEPAEAADRAVGRLEVLSTASARLAATLEVDEVLEILADVILAGFGRCLVVALDERLTSEAAEGLGVQDGAGFPVVHVGHEDAALQAALRERLREATLGPDGEATAEVRAALADVLGGGETLAVPLRSRGRPLGAVLVGQPLGSALDRRIVGELALRAGVALDNAVLFGTERRLGLILQRSLLPAVLPQPDGITLAARYLPATAGREVGGDFHLAHELDDGRLLLVIGDVMGHGMQAAARMGQLRAVVMAYAFEGDPPDRVLGQLSARAGDLLDLPLATLLLGVYDPAARELSFAAAGHLPPLLAVPFEPPAFVDVRPGPPLGTGPADHALHRVAVPPGSTLVLYTDGLIEDRRQAIDVGLEQLRDALDDVRVPPEAVCDHLLRQLARIAGAEDDVALLVLNHS